MKSIIKRALELGSRIYVFLLLSSYGLGKIIGQQFYRKGELPEKVASKTLAEAGSFDLAWTFMGYSNTYIIIVGGLQLIGAFCLLFNRTKLMGIMILLPILLNIIVFDAIFFDDGNYGALFSAILYFLLLILVLCLNKNTVGNIIKLLFKSDEKFKIKFRDVKLILVSIAVIGMFLIIDQLLVTIFGH